MLKITDLLKDKLKGLKYGYTAIFQDGLTDTNNKNHDIIKSLNKTISFNEKMIKGLGFEIEILNSLFKSDIPLYEKSNIYWNIKTTEETKHQVDICILTTCGIVLIECKNWDQNWSNDKYNYSKADIMFEKIEAIQKEIIKTVSSQYINAKKIFVFPNNTNINNLTQELNKQRNNNISKNFIEVCNTNHLIDTISKFFYTSHKPISTDIFNKLKCILKQQQSFDLTK